MQSVGMEKVNFLAGITTLQKLVPSGLFSSGFEGGGTDSRSGDVLVSGSTFSSCPPSSNINSPEV